MARTAGRRQRAEGQWALGYREPLNAAEATKAEDDGLNVRRRIEEVYAQKGFTAIWPSDLRSRFRWYGLYTQRPETDGYFMMRIRIPGGALTSEQLDVIGGVSSEFGRDVADVTDRQNVQLHWIRIEDVPEIWRRLEDVGLSTTEACGDTPRNILGCPLAGIDASEIVDASQPLRAANERLIGNPEFSNLPRKYKISISGCAHQCAQHEINDLAFVGAVHPELGPGLDLWVGGGLSTNPVFAVRLGAFVPVERVPDVVAGVTTVFREWGYRRARNHARLKFLVRDWGAERFRTILEEELGYRLADLAEPPASSVANRDHSGVWPQKDGRFYAGFSARAGRISGHQLRAAARIAATYGEGRLRTTTQQKIVITDIAEEDIQRAVDELEVLDLPVHPSAWRRNTIACTGIEFCKLAIVETKGRAAELYSYLERAVPDFEDDVRINVNGCPNSCARYQTADIGLMGCLNTSTVYTTDHDGNQVEEKIKTEAFLVHLGGHLGVGRAFGRKVRGVKVPASELGPYVEALIGRYRARRAEGESFASFIARLDDEQMRDFAARPALQGPPPPPAIVAEPRT